MPDINTIQPYLLSPNIGIIVDIVALVVIVLTPLSIVIARFVAKHTYDMFRKQSKVRAEQTAIIEETVKGAKLVKAFSREESQLEKFDKRGANDYIISEIEKTFFKFKDYSTLSLKNKEDMRLDFNCSIK